jgi:carboxypeptidase Taq
VHAESFSIWCEARAKNDWASVKPQLEKIVKLAQEEAQLVGYLEHPYDALLDSFEPYSTLSVVKPLLLSVANRLKKVLPELSEKYGKPTEVIEEYSTVQQQAFCMRVMTDLGFDFNLGRLDTAAHPFMSTLGARDIRITTRYNPKSFLPSLFGTIHESGHAFYEIGLPEEFRGTARGSAVSMGIHESQARLWENMVGRSHGFCQYISSILPEYFSTKHTSDTLWSSANTVHPSLIRVEADEVSYTLHIVVRMLLEERLISGDLKIADAPAAWNELYKEYLGLEVPEYSLGIMQDVHWYGGSIGYFPSYALGNLYGAMFIEQFELENGALKQVIEKGSFSLLKEWLRKNIFELGQTYPATELVKKVCNKPLSSEAFIVYLSNKFGVEI